MVASGPPLQIRRHRLLDRVVQNRVVLLDAPGGSGKTTLAEQCLDDWERGSVRVRFTAPTDLTRAVGDLARSVRRAGFADLAEAMAPSLPDSPVTGLDALVGSLAEHGLQLSLFVDDVHHLDDSAARELTTALRDLPTACRLIVAGRALGPLADLALAPGTCRLTADDLRMHHDEVAVLLGDGATDSIVDEIVVATTGWCAAVGLTVQRLAADPSWSPTAAGGARLLDELVADIVAEHPSVCALAALPLVDARVADTVGGPQLFGSAIAAGVLAAHGGRWHVVPDPIRESLQRQQPAALELDVVSAVAAHYYEHGEAAAAVEVLSTQGDAPALAAFLARLHWTELEALGPGTLPPLMDSLDATALDAHPELFVAASRAVELAVPDRRAAWLEGALAAVGVDGDETIRRAAQAEQARDLVSAARLDEAEALARAVASDCGPTESTTRGRALTTQARVSVFRCTADSLALGAQLYDEAGRHFREAGETRWLAEALARRGYTALYMAGYPEEGEAAMRDALALLPTGDFTRGFWLTNYSDVLDYLGRVTEAEAAVNEALEIGTRRRDRTLIGMAWWSRSWLAGHRGDLVGLLAALDGFDRNAGTWVRDGQWVEYLGSSAELLTMLDDLETYERFIDRARAAAAQVGYHTPVELAEARHLALHGDPDRAVEMLERLDAGTALVPSNRPTRMVLRSLAEARRGNLVEAERLRLDCVAAATSMGVPDLLTRYAHPVLRRLDALLSAGSAPAEPIITLRMLGGFSAEAAGIDCTPPPGHPASLVKLLALQGMTTNDAAIDALWPDADIATGRARLRNLLNRLKQRSGEIVVRSGEALQLHSLVSSDVAVFETRAAAALAATDDERIGLARHAIALYTGELLPGDVYDDWTLGPRERLKRRYLALVDLVADDAVARGDADEAIRLLDLGIAAEPLDEARYSRICAVLVDQGRVGTAREVAARAVATLGEIGAVIAPDLLDLAG